MLVLGREPGQTIRIGKDIFVTILFIEGQYVRVGVDAPKDIEIVRSEIEWQASRLAEPETKGS